MSKLQKIQDPIYPQGDYFTNGIIHCFILSAVCLHCRSPFPERQPTVTWTWEKKTTTSTIKAQEITTTKFYFPSSSSLELATASSQYHPTYTTPISTQSFEESKGPTRPTRPPKPSSFDLINYYPTEIVTRPPLTTSTTSTSTTTTTRRTTTPRPTTTTTRRTTTTSTPKKQTSLMAFNKNRPQQPRGASCGMPERSNSCPKGRIVNGTQSCYGQFPWQVRRYFYIKCDKYITNWYISSVGLLLQK